MQSLLQCIHELIVFSSGTMLGNMFVNSKIPFPVPIRTIPNPNFIYFSVP